MAEAQVVVHNAPVTGFLASSMGPRRGKTFLRWFANNKGADQHAHPRRMISAFLYAFWKVSYLNLLASL